MLKPFAFLLCLVAMSFTVWQTDFELARKKATETDRHILLNFSGSDWCGPCIRMHKDIFQSKAFSDMADTTLVLVNADFPRNKKNQLPADIRKENERLADRYNPEGKFPFTLLLDANGKVIETWDGMPDLSAGEFAESVKSKSDAFNN
jgi:thioredoxin-related protein